MNKLVKYSLLLAALCAIAGLLLAFVNSVTAPRIELWEREQRSAALREHFEYFDYIRKDDESKENANNSIQGYYYAFNDNKELAAVIYQASYQGYKSQIITLVSIKVSDSTIENVKQIGGNDTFDNDLKKHDFGISGSPINDYEFVHKTGITVTSDAILSAVQAAIKHFNTIKGELGGVSYE